MSDTVLILGAGFSHDAGIPLLSGFVERILHFQVRKKHGAVPLSDIDIFDAAISVRDELDGYHGRAMFDDRNIEDILSILSFNVLGGEPEEREKLAAINRAITRTIELSCTITHEGVKQDGSAKIIITGPESYRRFWKAILKWIADKNEMPAILTFNYDLVLERSLLQALVGTHYNAHDKRPPVSGIHLEYHNEDIPPQLFKVEFYDYRMSGDSSGTRLSIPKGGAIMNASTIEILKLHGSVNVPRSGVNVDAASYNFAASLAEPLILPLWSAINRAVDTLLSDACTRGPTLA